MSALDETLKRHRRRVIDREEQAFRELLSAYNVIEQELRASLRELERQIRDAQANGQAISPSWFSRERRLQTLVTQVKSQIERFGGTAAAITTREQRAAVTIAADAARETVEVISPGALPIGTSFNPLVVEDAVGMMGDGSPILEYYRENLAPKVAEAIRVEVIKAAATGTDFKTIARGLVQTGQITKQRALMVARTEVGRVRRETTRRIYQESGVTTGWEWVASISPRTCPACLAMDGKIFKLEDPFPQHINCRCTMIPVIEGVERPKRLTGREWLAKQPPEVLAQILGKEAAEAYARGDVTLDDFVGWATSKEFGKRVYTKPFSSLMGGGKVTENQIIAIQNYLVSNAENFGWEVSRGDVSRTEGFGVSAYVGLGRRMEGGVLSLKVRISDHAVGYKRAVTEIHVATMRQAKELLRSVWEVRLERVGFETRKIPLIDLKAGDTKTKNQKNVKSGFVRVARPKYEKVFVRVK